MAAIIKGTAHVYGVAGTVTSATVQSHNLKLDHQNKTNTLDESGNEIERRRDDLMKEGSIVLRIQAAYVEPAPGDVLSYGGENFEIDSLDHSETNNAHVSVTLSIKTTEYVTLV